MNLSDITPYGNRLIVKKLSKDENTSKSGLIMKSSANAPVKAEVLSVGNGVTKVQGEENTLKLSDLFSVGDIVLIPQYANQEIVIDGVTYLIINESDIFAHVPTNK
jgi:chaperonin GroES